MKVLSIPVLSTLAVFNGVAADNTYDAYQSTTCEGLEYSTCTRAELDFYAHTVEKTYNAIYGPNWYLFDTKWEGVRGENPQAVEKKRDQGERIMQSGGGWGCDLCPHDDDSFMVENTWNTDGNVWGDALALALRGIGMECFKSVSHCSISMEESKRLMDHSVAKKDAVAASTMYDAYQSTTCEGLDYATCTSAELDFFARTVEKTYNSIYGPNWYLFDTKWEGVRGENPQAVEKKQDQRIMQSGGGWGCDLCPHDDDSFMVENTWNTDGNVWGDALALALRGSGMECFKSVSHCSISMEETKRLMDHSVAIKDAVAASTMYDAYQSTTCEGLDYATCTSAELDFFARTVEKTYNSIYGPNWYLFDTKWEGVRGENPQAVEKKQDQRIMQSGGGWGCDLCPHDDDSFALDKTWNTDGNVWGDALALALRGSGMECFKSVSHCGITMDETKRLMEKKEDDAISAMRVKCQNVDWSVLTPTEQKFAASKLEKSFNTVFKNVEGGTTELKDVDLATDLTQMTSLVDLLVGFWWEGRYGYFTGSHVSDKAVADTTALRSTSNKTDMMIIALWESAFEKLLHRGPYSALSRAGDCQIEMKVVHPKR
ncbi:hypothetical protein ACA910_015476 [Epithemia clementina (nom. ined.)]